MKIVASCLFCLAAVVAVLSTAAENETSSLRDKDAEQVAEAWFTSLNMCHTAVTTSLSDVPFSVDNKKIVDSLAELRQLFDKIAEKEGRRELTPDSIRIGTSSPQAVDVIFVIADQKIVVKVRPGDAPRVVGFEDGPAS